jgi:hypothetical protein
MEPIYKTPDWIKFGTWYLHRPSIIGARVLGIGEVAVMLAGSETLRLEGEEARLFTEQFLDTLHVLDLAMREALRQGDGDEDEGEDEGEAGV